MDDLSMPTTTTASATSSDPDLRADLESLRSLVGYTIILVCVISLTLNMYLLRQMRYAQRDLQSIKQQATEMITQYQKVSAPIMDSLVRQITDYGRTHPDFAPILSKYGISLSNAPATPRPAPTAPPSSGTPGPGSTPPKK